MSNRPDFEPAETFPMDDLETLKLIVTEPRIEIIELLRKPSSVAQLAERMGVPRTRLYHHINTLEEIGAIVVVDERRAGALNEKIYQVAAKSFQPSEKFLESATPKEQAIGILDSLFSVTRSDLVRAVEREHVNLGDAWSRRSMMLARHMMTLTPERRTEFVGRLESLIHEFDDDDDESDETEPFGLLIIAHPSSRTTT
jgi:DNA-binding transcriptional ArsR family regulator